MTRRDPGPDDALGLVLSKLDGTRSQGGYWMARCPAHEDNQASLSVKAGARQPVVLKCHAGCDPKMIIEALGLDWSAVCGERDERELRQLEGLPAGAEAVYEYHDEHGRVLYRKVRQPGKKFYWQHPKGVGWKPGMGGKPKVLYRLPDVLAAVRAGRPVWVVEGEKDADAVRRAGATATCNFDGASGASEKPKVRAEYADTLTGADVIVWADDDEPGLAHAHTWQTQLLGKARSVRVVKAAAGKDAHDHLTAGKTLSDVVTLGGGGGDEEEELPEPSDPLPEIPRFPVDKLTGPLLEFTSWAVKDGLHPECAVAAGLAALVTLTGPARLKLSDAKVIKAILWTVLVGIASSGKSPAYEHAFSLIRAAYAEKRWEYEAELAFWREVLETQGKKVNGSWRRGVPAKLGRRDCAGGHGPAFAATGVLPVRRPAP